MSDTPTELIKQREIRFSAFPPDRLHSQEAMVVLHDLDGILDLQPLERRTLQVRYDVTQITREFIDTLLLECQFHLDNTLMSKFTRALHYYTEEAQRLNLGVNESGNSNQLQIYVNRYQQLSHGCRDQRPEHWRSYL